MGRKYLDSLLHPFSRGGAKTEAEKLIEAFNSVRDGHDFHFPINNKDFNNYCLPKHAHLKKDFEEMGYNVKFGACMFKWSNQLFPPQIKKHINADYDDECHFFLKIEINGKEQNVDCTFGEYLGIYNKWNAEKSTNIAVRKHDGILPYSDTLRLVDEYNDKTNREEKLECNRKFYYEANRFFGILKKTPGPARIILKKAFDIFNK